MSAMKIFTIINYINWILISVGGAVVLYYIINRTGHSDAAGQGLETAVLAIGIFVLLILISLNLLPCQWTKICTLFTAGLLLWWLYNHD